MDITNDFIIPMCVGVFIGLVTAFLFTRYSKVDEYIATIFSINSNVFEQPPVLAKCQLIISYIPTNTFYEIELNQ